MVFTISYISNNYATSRTFEGYWSIQYIEGNKAREVLPGDTCIYGNILYVDLQFLRTFVNICVEKQGYFFKLSYCYERNKRFAMKSYLMHETVDDKGGTCHITGVF